MLVGPRTNKTFLDVQKTVYVVEGVLMTRKSILRSNGVHRGGQAGLRCRGSDSRPPHVDEGRQLILPIRKMGPKGPFTVGLYVLSQVP